MIKEELDDSQVLDELTRWFIRRLDELEVNLEDEVFSYDCNTDYDFLFYRLRSDAQSLWESRYGFIPSPGLLTKAFFGAEYERARRDRLAKRGWVVRFSDFIGTVKRRA